jgi:hypothetical protein
VCQKRNGTLGTATLSERSGVDIPTYRENHNLDDSTTSPPVATFKTNPPSFYTSAKMENERGELVDRKDAYDALDLDIGHIKNAPNPRPSSCVLNNC